MSVHEEEAHFLGLRKRLVVKLQEKGIKNNQVLNAIFRVKRHLFFQHSLLHFAYHDKAYPIASGQTISQPFTVARQTELLELSVGDKVLEIGTGSGYQAAVLCEMGAKVWSIERHKPLHDNAKSLLAKLGYTVNLLYGDGFDGAPSFAPFEKIIITAAAPEIPETLLCQLNIGGQMVVPLTQGKGEIMLRITRIDEYDFKTERYEAYSFVPMLRGKV